MTVVWMRGLSALEHFLFDTARPLRHAFIHTGVPLDVCVQHTSSMRRRTVLSQPCCCCWCLQDIEDRSTHWRFLLSAEPLNTQTQHRQPCSRRSCNPVAHHPELPWYLAAAGTGAAACCWSPSAAAGKMSSAGEARVKTRGCLSSAGRGCPPLPALTARTGHTHTHTHRD